jgi:hypothetical protein
VRIILEDYLVAIVKHGVRGLPRKLEALERTAIGFAKLKLKDSVDEEMLPTPLTYSMRCSNFTSKKLLVLEI